VTRLEEETRIGKGGALAGQPSRLDRGEFDAIYVGQQAAAHDEAFNLHGSYAKRGDYPALKQLAQQTAAMVARHRGAARALDGKIGPTSGSSPPSVR
jgi:putative membrane protein